MKLRKKQWPALASGLVLLLSGTAYVLSLPTVLYGRVHIGYYAPSGVQCYALTDVPELFGGTELGSVNPTNLGPAWVAIPSLPTGTVVEQIPSEAPWRAVAVRLPGSLLSFRANAVRSTGPTCGPS